jgi:hypothetical protein
MMTHGLCYAVSGAAGGGPVKARPQPFAPLLPPCYTYVVRAVNFVVASHNIRMFPRLATVSAVGPA